MGQFESFIGINFWTALFVLINTLAVFFVARHFLFQPVRRMILSRQAEIDGDYASAAKAREEAERMQAELSAKLHAARDEGERIVKEARERGAKQEEEIIRSAMQEAETIRTRAGEDAMLERRKALNDAKNEISDMAMAVAEKLIGREINARDNDALVEEFIDALGDGK